MSKAILALGSFLVGACCASIISLGIHTSAWAQPSLFAFADTVPKITGLGGRMVRLKVTGGSQQLDGLDCQSCTFDDTLFTYSGGAFRFTDLALKGNWRVSLTGAAANTQLLLTLLHLTDKPQRPVPMLSFKPPILQRAKLLTPVTITRISTIPTR
jgi:hypothetical protein